MRKLYYITYYYPPMVGGGVPRAVNMLKSINTNNIKPIVVTVDIQHAERNDELLRIKNPWYKFDGKCSVPGKATGNDRVNKSHIGQIIKSMVKCFIIPDTKLLWAFIVFFKLLRRIRHDDIILTSSPPHSIHFCGLLLKLVKGNHWIADFRDAWTIDSLDKNQHSMRVGMERILENWVMKNSDAVIFNTTYVRRLYAEAYPRWADKLFVINNGFQTEILSYNKGRKSDDKEYLLSHFGALSKSHYQRTINNFIAAAHELLKDGFPYDFILRIEFYGDLTNEEIEAITSFKTGFIRMHYKGQVAYSQAIERMIHSDGLLLIDRCLNGGSMASNIPGKVFDYLACCKPIIPIVPEGACKDLLMEVGVRYFAEPVEISQIKALLLKFCEGHTQHTEDGFIPLSEKIMDYSHENMAKKLEHIIHTLS